MNYDRACRTGLILVFILLQGLTVSAKEPVWLELSSEHFVLFTETDQTKAQRVLTDLETRASAFAQAFGKIPTRQFPIEIFIFNTDQDFLDAFFFQAEDGIRDLTVTGVQTCALPI